MNGLKFGSSVLGALSALFVGLLLFGSYDFTQTETQLRGHAAQHLPKEIKPGMTIKSAEIDLLTDAADVTIAATLSRNLPGFGEQSYDLVLRAVAAPEYRFMNGTVHLDPREIEIVSVEQTGGVTLGEAGNKAKRWAERLLPQRESEIDEVAYAAKELAPEIQAWLETRAGELASWYLERYPVYTLPNTWKGYAAQAVLDDISITSELLVVSISFRQLMLWVVIWSIIGLLSIGYGFLGTGPISFGGRSRY